ncbi:MAG TPA: hypothetical protein VGS19_35845 [Streptosporangiaceae bacterium]|nr:hypothetical protein [Streptosporangiaceae bacterium]
MDSSEWVSALGRYAGRLHANAGQSHHVVSPLGAWLVLALCAPLTDGGARDALADVLGAGPAQAAAFAASLLDGPHPLVAAGAGVWVSPVLETEPVKEWVARLPALVDIGDIPTQAEADAWVVRRTLGLIDHFPLDLQDMACLVASALATKVSWEVPFDVVGAEALGPGPWADMLRHVLRPPRGDPRHRQYLTRTRRAGPVGVHLAGARGGLLVGSVVAAPEVAFTDVLAAAEEIVTAEARKPGSVPTLSLADLPLGDGPVWSLREETSDPSSAGGRRDEVVCVLPAWSAHTDLGLLGDESLGFGTAAQAIADALKLAAPRFDARQSAMARYSATGFEAAAVTVLGVRLSAMLTPQRRRVATVRFAHPYAVVAAAYDDRQSPQASEVSGAWHGLPVFSAWVTEPADAGSL